MKNTILKGLVDLLNCRRSFESALIQKFDLDDIPYNRVGLEFPRVGSIDVEGINYDYRFHGRGCCIENGIQKLDYSVNPTSKNKYDIVSRNFMLFIQSYMKDENVQKLTSQATHEFLVNLRDEGILGRSELSEHIFELIEDKIFEAYNKEVIRNCRRD